MQRVKQLRKYESEPTRDAKGQPRGTYANKHELLFTRRVSISRQEPEPAPTIVIEHKCGGCTIL
jgi:hypothetical protein